MHCQHGKMWPQTPPGRSATGRKCGMESGFPEAFRSDQPYSGMPVFSGILARARALFTLIAPRPDAPIAASLPTRRDQAIRAVMAATVSQLIDEAEGGPNFPTMLQERPRL